MLVAHNPVMFGQHCHLGLQKGTKHIEKQFAYQKSKYIQQLTAKIKKEMPTAPSVPKRSPIQVLTGLNIGLTSVIGLFFMLTLRYTAVGGRKSPCLIWMMRF